MESWFIYAILAMVTIGAFGIFQKIEAETEGIDRDAFIFYAYLGSTILGLIVSLLLLDPISQIFDWEVIGSGCIISLLYVSVLRLRHTCLQYMDSSTYFINYRILVSSGLLIAGQVLFGEHISVNEYVGVGIGFVIFYLLLDKKNFDSQEKNKKMGMIFYE